MKMMFRFFAKKLFGAKYERSGKNIFIGLIVFWCLSIADLQVEIAPFILYLMTTTFTAGVMWQALSSEENVSSMTNLFMMPFEGWKFIFSYIGALGSYTLATKTWLLLAVVYAVSKWSAFEIVCSIFCALNAILMSAVIYSMRKYRTIGFGWFAGIIVLIFLKKEPIFFLALLLINFFVGVIVLRNADAYSFYQGKQTENQRKVINNNKNPDENKIEAVHCHSIWKYFFRYLMTHKNYLLNTFIMWGVACLLPRMFIGMEKMLVLPIAFAILSLNTPICILLSCDPALEQAVRFLPGQKKAFFVPYCLFIFLCNMTANAIFLLSYEVQLGGITLVPVLMALCFAGLSAIGSVLLECFYPIRGYSIESDLWHHPRKYVVPGMMILLAGVIGMAWR